MSGGRRSGPARLCPIAAGALAVLYLAALAILAIGTFGLFGSPRDPLSGIYLMPLGLPWTLLDPLPDPVRPWLAVLAPALNIAILWQICRWITRRTSRLRPHR